MLQKPKDLTNPFCQECDGSDDVDGDSLSSGGVWSRQRADRSLRQNQNIILEHLRIDNLTMRCCLNREYNQSEETHSTSLHLQGIALATCCHHLCQWKHYTKTKFLLSLGITEEEFHAMTWFTSWAVDADHSSELSDLSHQETNLSTM
ncbi:U11-48K-like CHHC zinc finger [Musa troglodytarum]|uniref:tRNA:m(4)X modification enzyme TRM13 n=1 Tax=Musa troglodytarum TaxID=320322 RepID=A0A9E7FUE9_9LILI|nr:U11-48K-like CHHC zinc finger [Musa troglodytarum]